MEKEKGLYHRACNRCGKPILLGTLCALCEKDWKEYKSIMWLRFLDEGSTHQLVSDISMPESFDDLVRLHGKDVIRDWLEAILD